MQQTRPKLKKYNHVNVREEEVPPPRESRWDKVKSFFSLKAKVKDTECKECEKYDQTDELGASEYMACIAKCKELATGGKLKSRKSRKSRKSKKSRKSRRRRHN
jgi:hypothetical protein